MPAGLNEAEAEQKPFIASMGIYVFKKDLMLKLLREQAKCNDFGGEIIPKAASTSRVMAYLFNDYWEDIGTIKSFFEANLGLAQQVGRRLTSLRGITVVSNIGNTACLLICSGWQQRCS